MPSRALLIEVRLLDGRYHGVGDWPPAPFRLFQALVAGAYGGRWRSEPEPDKDAAFRWLEGLAPPHIAVPAKIDARPTMYFVPNNDIDSVEGDPRRVSEIRSGKVMRPILLNGDVPLLYAWPFEGGDDRARQLCDLADRLHTLGHGIDAAFARAEVCDWGDAETRLRGHGGAVCRPAQGGGLSNAARPIKGSLDSLKQRHAAGARRFEKRNEGRGVTTLFHQPPKAQFGGVVYDRKPARLLFELRSTKDTTVFEALLQKSASGIATQIRDIVAAQLIQAQPQRAAEIERLVVGRDAGQADASRRLRILPLPSIGFRHTSPSIRRVLVEIPPDCPFTANDISIALAGQGLERVNPVTGELEGAVLMPADDRTMLGHYGIGGRVSRRWYTVTPAALPEPRQKGRVKGGDRAASDQRDAIAVAEALRHVGLDWRGIAVRVQQEPLSLRGLRADAFDPDRFAGRLRHVEITFPAPVAGPLVIGDGLWLGLGVMAPFPNQPAPALHLFAIDPAEAPPVAAREAVARALRNAVMARVRDEIGGDRRSRDEPLPTFFTGHLEGGQPARSGRHEHLFFIADDSDGDGKIDRLAVVAPHLADRSGGFDAARDKEIQRHLETLDRALAGFTTLRAGRAGAPVLSRIGAADDDALFGHSKSWVSRSPYRPTRHPRSGDAAAAIAADIIAECSRRGLRRPEVEIPSIDTGPRGGLAVRARLRFEIAVSGPVLLGRDSHFGAGMFGAER